MYCIQDPIRWKPLTDVVDGYSPTLPHLKGLQNGDTATSAIKQLIALTEKKLSSILRFGRVGKKGLIHGHHFMVHSCRALAIEII